MLKKFLVVTAFSAGYVLGAKAGKERYEQIRTLFLRVKTDPNVRVKVHEAVEFAQEQGAHLTEKAVQAVKHEKSAEADLRPHGTTLDPEGISIRL